MKKSTINALSYPPPPPPPPPSSKRFSKILIAAIVIVFVVVAVVGAYYVMTLSTNNNGPNPSASPTPLATSTPFSSPATSTHSTASPTSTHSATPTYTPSGQSYAGYRVGAWTNYTLKNYDGLGTVTNQYLVRYTVDQGIIKGVDCWILQTEMAFSSQNSVTKTTTTYWLDKSNLQGLHYKIEVSSNGTIISTTENDYSPGDVNSIPTAIAPNMVISKETVTVPAGTFNCDKTATTTTDLGNTYVTTMWGNSNVPVVGMVKQEITSNGALISATELTAYGG